MLNMTHGSIKSPYGTHFIDTHSHDEPTSHTARVFDNETVMTIRNHYLFNAEYGRHDSKLYRI